MGQKNSIYTHTYTYGQNLRVQQLIEIMIDRNAVTDKDVMTDRMPLLCL